MANEEQILNITERGQYKNIDLKDIDNDNYIIVQKIFEKGLEKKATKGDRTWNYYIIKARYNDEEVGFILSDTANSMYKELGGIDDKIKITCHLVEKKNQKGQFYKSFTFDLIQ